MRRCRLCGNTTDNPVAAKHWLGVGKDICPGWWEDVPEPTNWLLILLMSVGIVLGVVLFITLVTLL